MQCWDKLACPIQILGKTFCDNSSAVDFLLKTNFPESIWLAKYIVSRITIYCGCDNTCYKLSSVIITVSTDCLLLAPLLKDGKEKKVHTVLL